MDLRRKRMLCQRFFAIILYLKVVAYTGKVFGRMDPQMWPSFCPLALGKGWGCVWFREGTSWQGLLGGSQLPEPSRFTLIAYSNPHLLCACASHPPWVMSSSHILWWTGEVELLFWHNHSEGLGWRGGRCAQQVPCDPVWSMLQLPLASDLLSFIWKLNCWEGEGEKIPCTWASYSTEVSDIAKFCSFDEAKG